MSRLPGAGPHAREQTSPASAAPRADMQMPPGRYVGARDRRGRVCVHRRASAGLISRADAPPPVLFHVRDQSAAVARDRPEGPPRGAPARQVPAICAGIADAPPAFDPFVRARAFDTVRASPRAAGAPRQSARGVSRERPPPGELRIRRLPGRADARGRIDRANRVMARRNPISALPLRMHQFRFR